MYTTNAFANDGRILINNDGTVLVDSVCVFSNKLEGGVFAWFAKDDPWEKEIGGDLDMLPKHYPKGYKIPKDDGFFWFDEYADGVEPQGDLPSAN